MITKNPNRRRKWKRARGLLPMHKHHKRNCKEPYLDEMKHITFSNGDIVCSIGQGTWNMGRNPLREKQEATALLTGIELGMNMIDTAEMYGNERFIGKVIKPCRDKVFLVSKVHPDNANYHGTIRACEESLRRLGCESLDMYLLHWKSRYPLSETVESMCRLQRDGKIRLWGVSNLDVDDMERIDDIPNGCGSDANQVLYNLQERGVEFDLIPYARQRDIPIIAYSPVGEGRLLRHPVLKTIAEKHDATPAQVALSWTIRNSGVMAIPKASTADHVKENFGSLSISLDADDMELLDISFPPPQHKIPLAGW